LTGAAGDAADLDLFDVAVADLGLFALAVPAVEDGFEVELEAGRGLDDLGLLEVDVLRDSVEAPAVVGRIDVVRVAADLGPVVGDGIVVEVVVSASLPCDRFFMTAVMSAVSSSLLLLLPS
jgi:hypothetical protein